MALRQVRATMRVLFTATVAAVSSTSDSMLIPEQVAEGLGTCWRSTRSQGLGADRDGLCSHAVCSLLRRPSLLWQQCQAPSRFGREPPWIRGVGKNLTMVPT